jgi:hypothetical protein
MSTSSSVSKHKELLFSTATDIHCSTLTNLELPLPRGTRLPSNGCCPTNDIVMTMQKNGISLVLFSIWTPCLIQRICSLLQQVMTFD